MSVTQVSITNMSVTKMFNTKSLLTLVLSLFTFAVFAGATPQISQQDLLNNLEKPNNIVILDVRTKEEYNNGHVANAINVSHDSVADNLAKLAQYKDNTVVVYCRSGRRAGFAENILAEADFKNVLHLTGDMNGWVEAKLPVVTSK